MLFGRAAPCTRRSRSNVNVKSWLSVGWRGGSGCGGRCKYVHVSSVAASMRLTPPQPDPPRLRQVPAAVGRCRPWPTRSCLVGDDRWSSPERAQRRDPLLIFFFFSVAGRPRKLSEAGRVGHAGALAPWMAPSSLHGRTCSVPCMAHPPGQTRDPLCASNHEGLSRSPPTPHPARAGDPPSRRRSSAHDDAARSSTPAP